MTFFLKLNNKKISLKVLRSILIYDPISGNWYWNKRFHHKSKKKKGDIAGSLCESDGYITITVNGNRYPAHRLAWFYMTGEWPPDHIDHKNLIRDDNRWKNLRLATSRQNQLNTKIKKNNTVGIKGISVDKATGKYRASIMINRVSIKSKRVDTIKEAEILYKELMKLQGESEFIRYDRQDGR